MLRFEISIGGRIAACLSDSGKYLSGGSRKRDIEWRYQNREKDKGKCKEIVSMPIQVAVVKGRDGIKQEVYESWEKEMTEDAAKAARRQPFETF